MIQIFTFNPFEEHTMVAYLPGRHDCVIVDPGCYTPRELEQLLSFLERSELKPSGILLTHAHPDHIFGVATIAGKYGCPVWLSAADQQEIENNPVLTGYLGLTVPEPFAYNDVKDGQKLSLAGFEFEAISTPGHTAGGMCYLERSKGFLFTGDSLFAGTIGRTDFKYGDYDALISSIMEKLITLDPSTTIFPGHGESSTIGHERTHNPMLEPFNEPEPDCGEDLQPIIIRNV